MRWGLVIASALLVGACASIASLDPVDGTGSGATADGGVKASGTSGTSGTSGASGTSGTSGSSSTGGTAGDGGTSGTTPDAATTPTDPVASCSTNAQCMAGNKNNQKCNEKQECVKSCGEGTDPCKNVGDCCADRYCKQDNIPPFQCAPCKGGGMQPDTFGSPPVQVPNKESCCSRQIDITNGGKCSNP